MLSIGKLGASGGAEYYLDKVANSVDDYYLGRGEAPGHWVGATSEQLGLVGQVDAEALSNLLAGRSASGEALGARLSAGAASRLRPDLLRRPRVSPCSGPSDRAHIRASISDAHDRAVAAVLDQLSTEACFVRRGSGGRQLMEANGFIGAAFRHRTSRAGDPQLHTHVVVPNLVQGADGRWSAPDGRHLYAWKKTAGTLYQSALRAELAPLGLRWQVGRNGLGELRDIPKAVLRFFSKRRVDIESAMEQRGLTSSKSAEGAALATRERRARTEGLTDVLREGWAEQLASIELPDGEGGLRAATTDDVTAALGAEATTRPTGAAEVDCSHSGHPCGRERCQPRRLGDRRHRLAGAATGPGSRAMPVTLLGSTFTHREALMAVARAFDVTPDRGSRH